MKAARAARLLAIPLLIAAAPSLALPPTSPWEDEGLTFRLLLGSFDGNENSRLIHDDGQHYAIGLSASSPIAWEKRLEANLEIWANERGYPAASTAGGEATGALTFESVSIDYGLRAHTLGALRPYALATIGFQANRLEGETTATPPAPVRDDNLVPAAQVGVGVEWVVGHDHFSLDWRRRFVRGDFTDFGVRGLDLGGSFVGIGLGHHW